MRKSPRVMEQTHQRVRKILSERRKVLDNLAHLLSEKEIVQGEELRQMLSESADKGASGLTGAGAMNTRCCSSPESCDGIASARCAYIFITHLGRAIRQRPRSSHRTPV